MAEEKEERGIRLTPEEERARRKRSIAIAFTLIETAKLNDVDPQA